MSALPATDLGGLVIKEAMQRAGVEPAQIDEVRMGQVFQGGVVQAPARQAALKGGLPDTIAATTINKVCGSGLKTVMIASSEIRAGEAEAIVAGGMENMSLAPYFLTRARSGYRLGHGELTDLI
jgi:acetyl-CoA C-acetyltransferase